jgi:protein SCO1/2
MFKINHIFRFIIWFWIYAVPKIISRIQNNEVVKGDRLDNVEATKVIDEINKIGPAPKFDL